MCGRYAYSLPPEAIRGLFSLDTVPSAPPRYNIAPTQPVIAVWQDEGGRAARLARWGLVPHWVKDPREFPLLVNARSETIAQKPAFRDAFRHHRCVVPASGYYEWHRPKDGAKQPYYICYADQAPLPMAGLYSTWIGPEGEEVDTVAIITVPANQELAPIHDRMPALLAPDAIDDWLDVRSVSANVAQSLLFPAPQGRMAARKVSSRVNSARNEGADLIAGQISEPTSANADKPMADKPKNSSQLDLF